MARTRSEVYFTAFRIVRALVVAVILTTATANYLRQYSGLSDWKLPNGRIIGGDFIAFYMAGTLYRTNAEALYDFDLFLQAQRTIYQEHGLAEGALPFAYPPLVAAFFSVLSGFEFVTAYYLWAAASTVLVFGALLALMLREGMPISRCAIYLLYCCAFMPFVVECIAGGQTSALGLAIFAGAYLLLTKGHQLAAGLVLSLGYYKPPLFIGIFMLMLLLRQWRVVLGAALGGVALLLATVATFGAQGTLRYVQSVSSYRYGAELTSGISLPVEKGVGLYAFYVGLLPTGIATVAYIVSSAALVVLAVRACRDIADPARKEFALCYAAISAVSLFVSPQMVAYDLTIVLVSLVLVWCNLSRRWSTREIVVGATTVALYLEFAFRSVAIGPLSLQLGAAVFGSLCLALLSLTRERSEVRSNNSLSAAPPTAGGHIGLRTS